MQGSQRVRECVAKMQVGSGWSQRVWEWHWVLGDDSDDSGMMWVGWDRANRGRYGHGRDT